MLESLIRHQLQELHNRTVSCDNCLLHSKSFPGLHEYNETPYELQQNLKFLHVFGALCYLTNDSKDLGKLKPKADIGIFPMFGEYFQPSPSVVSQTISATTLPHDRVRATSSTTIDQDAPSLSTTPNTEETTTPIHDADVEEPN
ncbi:hypothetical protein Tco_0222970 [Tanacetum coccineum]